MVKHWHDRRGGGTTFISVTVRGLSVICHDNHWIIVSRGRAGGGVGTTFLTVIILGATRENRSSGFPTRSDTNRAAHILNKARDLKFRI